MLLYILNYEYSLITDKIFTFVLSYFQSAIVDVNEIFRDLGAMVTEQGDMIGKYMRAVCCGCYGIVFSLHMRHFTVL